MAYQNEAVVARYCKDFSLSKQDAQVLFDDVKRFLWLSALTHDPLAPPPKVDDGWHTFIIFTQDYMDFCETYFGRYRHHRPRRPEDPVEGGKAIRSTVRAVKKFFGGFESLSGNWTFPRRSMETNDCSDCCDGSSACRNHP